MYQLTEKQIWQGRTDDDPKSLRYHQIVQIQKKDSLTKPSKKAISLIGFACDEGVRRNQGRIGAAEGPKAIREQLASLPVMIDQQTSFIDLGDIRCLDHRLESAQILLGEVVSQAYDHHFYPIILGGGHETFYGHYLGIRKSISEEETIGLINIDAHFDLRTDDLPSSGTMFQQILSEDSRANYLCIGIQEFGNTKALFEEAKRHDCRYIFAEDALAKETFSTVEQFAKQHDHIIVTLCMDSIVSTAAPGVSAPSPFGLEPATVRTLLRHIIKQPNVRSFDISELNPKLDQNFQTSRLAAYLVSEVIKTFAQK